MTKKDQQKLFNRTVRGLASQGFERSMAPLGDGCAYRGQDGCRCAIGWLIPNKRYSPDLEGWGASRRCVRKAVAAGSPGFLAYLQRCHDQGRTPDEMKKNLRAFASDHGLALPKVLG